jgi:hypothetical protein
MPRKSDDFLTSVGNKAVNILRTESVKYINKSLPKELRPTRTRRPSGVRRGGRRLGATRAGGGLGGEIINQGGQGGNVNIYFSQPAPSMNLNPFDHLQASLPMYNPVSQPVRQAVQVQEVVRQSVRQPKRDKKSLLTAENAVLVGESLLSTALAGGTASALKAGSIKAFGLGARNSLLTSAVGFAPPLISAGLVAGGIALGSGLYDKYKDYKQGQEETYVPAPQAGETYVQSGAELDEGMEVPDLYYQQLAKYTPLPEDEPLELSVKPKAQVKKFGSLGAGGVKKVIINKPHSIGKREVETDYGESVKDLSEVLDEFVRIKKDEKRMEEGEEVPVLGASSKRELSSYRKGLELKLKKFTDPTNVERLSNKELNDWMAGEILVINDWM